MYVGDFGILCTICKDFHADIYFLTPAAHQIRQAPSSDTMQGPTGLRGVQGEP